MNGNKLKMKWKYKYMILENREEREIEKKNHLKCVVKEIINFLNNRLFEKYNE